MDFDQFNNRAKAEIGFVYRFRDPNTDAPLGTDDSYPGVYLRGSASPVFQALLREKQKNDLLSEEGDEEKGRVMEDTHNMFIDMAIPYIIRFQGVEFTDPVSGKSVVPSTEEQYRAFLDMTFPMFTMVEAKDGPNALKMVNKPFANQIINAVNDYEAKLGNVSGV